MSVKKRTWICLTLAASLDLVMQMIEGKFRIRETLIRLLVRLVWKFALQEAPIFGQNPAEEDDAVVAVWTVVSVAPFAVVPGLAWFVVE